MKTIFQPDEIKNLIYKKWDELQGENILLQINTPKSPDEINNVSEGMNTMYSLGKNHGVIEGQMKFLSEIMDFFEISK